MPTANAAPKTAMQRFLDGVEKVGNMVPHPVVIFLILIAIVIALSAVLGAFGAAVSFERINPDTHEIEIASTEIRSLINADGIRFMYASPVPNFMSFTAVGTDDRRYDRRRRGGGIGLGHRADPKARHRVAALGSDDIFAFVGILASVAADAGYLVLILSRASPIVLSAVTRWPVSRRASPQSPPLSLSTPLHSPEGAVRRAVARTQRYSR